MFDGDGTGEDRQLSNIVRTVSKLVKTPPSEKEIMLGLFEKALLQIKDCEISKQRSQLVRKRVIEEIDTTNVYSHLLTQLHQEITQDINESKKVLNSTQSVKQIRMQFDLLANRIKLYKSYNQYQSDIEELTLQINQLQTEYDSMGQRLKMYEHQCTKISFYVNSICAMLQDEGIFSNDVSNL